MMLMYCAGLISALLGIGSGVLKVPAMDTVLRLPMKVSSAETHEPRLDANGREFYLFVFISVQSWRQRAHILPKVA
jgi:hypothetical protein